MRRKQLFLTENWQFKARTSSISLADDFALSDGWLPASVPGTVHDDLLTHGMIEDPFSGLNEQNVQWVGEQDWLYTCHFSLPRDWPPYIEVTFCCEGLDTFATVWLNETLLFSSDTMFVPQKQQITSLLHPGENSLRILFESALRRGKEREAQYGVRPIWCESDASRAYVRKAQYHYGWDWGPVLLTAGPWRPIYLEMYTVRITDFTCLTDVVADLTSATILVKVDYEHIQAVEVRDLVVHIQLSAPDGALLEEALLPLSGQERTHTFTLSPMLWWPRGYGEQALYRVSVEIQQGNRTLDRRELRIGLRRLRLLQHTFDEQSGSAFCFEINNTPIFCGGANWIPIDPILSRVTPEDYRRWLHLAADAHMTMLRVWGGGIYEADIFYDLCDELGLLVWQDFMFACALYPALDWFQESVRAEAEAAVLRLRHHPSLALWCGNNEDYMHSAKIGLYDADFQGDLTMSTLPARVIYEEILPEVCAKLDPTRPYWRGSPYGGANANDAEQGDQHIWNVWHDQMAVYQDYPRFGGRFISEFGMQAMPMRATIETFTAEDERYPLSRTLEHHNKAPDGSRRLAVYLSDTVHLPKNLDEYIYATQFVQAEALTSAIRSWRRRWAGPGREYTAGALVWQLNDCWPVTSWALVDSLFRPKPAYYTVRRALAPLTLELAQSLSQQAELWAVNGTLAPIDGEIEIERWELKGICIDKQYLSVTLLPNRANEVHAFAFHPHEKHVLSARLKVDGKIVARAVHWPEPFKYLTLPEPDITLEQVNATTFQISARRPAKGVWLFAEQDEQWSDNMLDLIPGDQRFVSVDVPLQKPVKIRWLQ